MAEETQPLRRRKNGAPMSSTPRGSEEIPLEADQTGWQAPYDGPDSTGKAAGTGLPFELNGSHHAQIAQAVFMQERLGVAIAGRDGRIERVNQALANLLQYSQEELAGTHMEDLIHDPDQRQILHELPASQPAGQGTASAVVSLARKSGDTIPCLVDSRPICDENGKANHFLLFVADSRSASDADERNRFESELCHAQSLQTLGMLAGGVAHDFNNALEVIIGFASLARIRLSTADPLHEPLKIIEESAKGAASLARQLLDVSKDNPDDEELVDTNALLGTALSIVSRTFDRKIRIEHRIDSHLPCIRGSRNRLAQAILNLCINARDAMQQGGTMVIEGALQTLKPGDTRLPASNSPGHYVQISVRDTGEGISAETIKKIFVPLFSTKSHGRGFGLGLPMVDRIVKDAHGFIAVSSKPGEGSEFSLYLPAIFSKRPQAVNCRKSRMVSGRGGVLVVDDEPRVLEFLEKGLTRLGYQVVTAESGSKACEIYSRRSKEIKCILLDLIMPGMSGLEVYARLRDINPNVKVILSSGYSSGHIRQKAEEAGSPEFLEKPFTLEQLSQTLQKIQQN